VCCVLFCFIHHHWWRLEICMWIFMKQWRSCFVCGRGQSRDLCILTWHDKNSSDAKKKIIITRN
jgi:hypothetical protein